MSVNFKAFMVEKDNDGTVTSDFKDLSINDLPEGEVLIKVQYSGINYKDLATVKDMVYLNHIQWFLELIWQVQL